ncbi:AsmA-like C-terminal region-containing protein [Aliiruegeria lutimaris]|uniref:YhdP central domain-containing protein n=1 Tax=Aliiruegeria lutimaris TaxID=571298 RepID=A0A1G8J8D5_9RHOB|nr:AsmA-like C-terminal region-containing protein [Aliiruegeria lutimaris]SDI27519.1 Protein of unknown function [Aliiruegeria lutimaris]
MARQSGGRNVEESQNSETGDDRPQVDPERAPRQRRRKRWRVLSWSLFILFDIVVVLGVGLFLASLTIEGRDLPTPDWAAEKAGDILSRGLEGGQTDVGEITIRMAQKALPEVVFRDVTVTAPDGSELLNVPALQLSVDKRAIWQGKLQPRALEVVGAKLELRRKADGTFDLGFGSGERPAAFESLDSAIDAVQQLFELPALAPVEKLEVRELEVFYEDARAERAWRVSDGTMLLTHQGDALSLSVALEMPVEDGEDAEPSTVALRLSMGKTGAEAEASVLVQNVRAIDIAAHSPVLSWLEPLKARVSGAMIVGRTDQGAMGSLNGTLEIGPGLFQPETGARPIPFDGARTYFGYRPEQGRISFEELDIHAHDGTLSATGQVYFEGLETGWPTALVGQFAFSELRLDPPGLLREPALFGSGALDLKVSLDPFRAEIGQLVMTTSDPDGTRGQTDLRAAGLVTADDAGWHVSLQLGFDQIRAPMLAALWPLNLVPGTRSWIEDNLLSGRVHDARGGLRIDQGTKPQLALSFEFSDAEVQAMKTLPPVTGARGYASVGGNRFALTLEEGQMRAPRGGVIDATGTTLRVADMRQKPANVELLLKARAPVTAALSVLDEEPFNFLTKAGQPVDLATGEGRAEGRIVFPLKRGLQGRDVDFEVTAYAEDLRSEVLVPNRVLEGKRGRLTARREGLVITGDGALDGVPFAGATVQIPFGEDAAAPTVEGEVEIGEGFVQTFGIGLPKGAVTGAGPANFALELPREGDIRYSLKSDLRGVGLSLPPLGWNKAAKSEGRLQLSGRLGARPNVEALSLKAAGLNAEGSVTTSPEGGLQEALFTRVSVGDWLDAPVVLKGRGLGREPAIELRGGRIDIRKTSIGGASSSGASSAGPPVTLTLDRLTISDGIALTGFRGELTKTAGYSGNFTGSVNGQVRVDGTLVPAKGGGTAVRIRSDNAGAVFKAAGMFQQANGGSMSLILQPRGAPGEYDGQLQVEDVRVRSSSGLTALLNAITVVGLIDELNGAGLLFSDVEAVFRLTPSFVHVTRSSGVGPSLGISMEGVYDMNRDRLNMQGVFSPVYMVNSIGRIFTRKGEGLIGFTYRMRGSSSNPSVEVNPLSALTPGMFRDIFRAPPPQPRGGG